MKADKVTFAPSRMRILSKDSGTSDMAYKFLLLSHTSGSGGLIFYTVGNRGSSSSISDVSPFGLYRDSDCETGCNSCYPDWSKCAICKPGYIFYNFKCYIGSGGCPMGTFRSVGPSTPSDNGEYGSVCIPCHESCSKCEGMGEICESCKETMRHSSHLQDICVCSHPLEVYSNGACQELCQYGDKGIYHNKCMPACPQHTFPLIDYASSYPWRTTTLSYTVEPNRNAYTLLRGDMGGPNKGLLLPTPSTITALPTGLTLTFWVYKIGAWPTPTQTLVWAFGSLSITYRDRARLNIHTGIYIYYIYIYIFIIYN